jgi:hypothetical protein
MEFLVYIGVKNGCQDDAKMNHIKYDVSLKKWYIKYNYDDFMKDENLKPPKGFRAYGIQLLDNNVVDRKEYSNKIYNKLLERYEKN